MWNKPLEGNVGFLHPRMKRLQILGSKRPRQASDGLPRELTSDEKTVYNLIHSRGDMGIWKGDLKRELKNMRMVDSCIKNLLTFNKVKEVKNVQNRGRNHLVAAEFEPSKELTGGAWYSDGNLDKEFIDTLKKFCKLSVNRQKVATPEGILDEVKRHGLVNVAVNIGQVKDILKTLVLDNEIIEVKSNGIGDFASIPIGTVCYRCVVRGGSKVGAMTSIPCGVCPRINQCTPNGVISPSTCVYFTKWLDF